MYRVVTIAILAGIMACSDGAHEHECVEGEVRCSGDVLEECTHDDGWVESQDCAATGQMCHESMGHCMDMDTDM